MSRLLLQDLNKRDFHLWCYHTHNPRALHEQFPQYTLTTFHRIRKGKQPKYMPDRVYLTFKGILEYADHHQREAGKLKLKNLAAKHGISLDHVRALNKSPSKASVSFEPELFCKNSLRSVPA